ncbi:tyrosine-type recombinase/integrase [Candidatus Sumerlaeota bacterium]|nr:tyrosine-type recombinase/integrase [Candidatus Sumerlaeota bacterium]
MADRFSKILYDFAAYLEVQKNLSPRTQSAYVYDLERFSNFIIGRQGRMPHPSKINREDLIQFLESIQQEKNYKSTTLSRLIASIRVFFEFCAIEKIIEGNPAQYLHNPKIPKKLPVFLTAAELKSLLESPDRSTLDGKRDYAMMVVFAFTGCRLSELAGLKIKDINFSGEPFIRVYGKGAKERMIPLNEMAANAVREWLDIRPPSEDQEIFLNRFGNKISGRGMENIVKKHVQATGLTHIKISPHKLRHTFATLLHLKEVDIIEIKALMGHADISSTQIYTHTNAEKKRSAVAKLDSI